MLENKAVECYLWHDKYMQVGSSFVLGMNKCWRDQTVLQPTLIHVYVCKEIQYPK